MSLIKKLILVAGLKNLTETIFRTKTRTIVAAAGGDPAPVPGLDPTPVEAQAIVDSLDTAYVSREALALQQKENTELIISISKSLNDLIIDDWMPVVQKFCDGDVAKAKSLGYGVKGETPPDHASDQNIPIIGNIDLNVHAKHTLYIHNNLTLKVGLPKGISRIDIYGQTGGSVPADLAALIVNGGGYLGEATKGKFVNTFITPSIGTFEHYVAVYIDAKTKKPFSQSVVGSAIIR